MRANIEDLPTIENAISYSNVYTCKTEHQEGVLNAIEDHGLEVVQLDYSGNGPLGSRSMTIVVKWPEELRDYPDFMRVEENPSPVVRHGNIYCVYSTVRLCELSGQLEEAGLKVVHATLNTVNQSFEWIVVADWR